MRLGTAIEHLVDNYRYAKSKVWIRDEVAWALYHTWKEADDRKDEPSGYNLKPVEDEATISKMEQVEWTKEDCKGCKYNEYPYDSGTCFVRVCINGNKYEPKDEPQEFTWGKEVHEFCKMCDKSRAKRFDGDTFIVCGQSNDDICITLYRCPMNKWKRGDGYRILPMDEPQTERGE